MPSERIQRQIDQLLDDAESAIRRRDWAAAHESARGALAFDAENPDALALLDATERMLTGPSAETSRERTNDPPPTTAGPTETLAVAPTGQTAVANGRYQIDRLLGEGATKKVYLARDTRLDREVALALIKTDALDEAGLARVRREAQAMARLGDHPNVVAVYDIGEEAGQPYIVSQLMAGGDVEGLLRQAADHRLPLEQAIQIVNQVAAALEHAHRHGIVHRDLKPGNVWLTSEGVAKLGDFGLAMALDRSRLTQAGMMVGTVSYMPPEQALAGEVTPRSDLYSLGCMLYEMVCGRPPFVADESIAIITQHLNVPPVDPSWHAPDCPRPLEALILRLLEKNPAKRPESAAQVLAVLSTIRPGQPSGVEVVRPEANPLDRLARGVFVGRGPELAQGRAAVDQTVSGRTGLLLIAGDLGIGKTRLAEEIATYATVRGATVLWGASSPSEGAPAYWPWLQALRSFVRTREPARLRSELGSAGPEVARLVTELRERLPDLPQPAAVDPAQERFRLFDAVAAFLRNASAGQPLVIVLDNLHYADPPTMLLLQFLVQEASDARLLIVGTYRDAELGRRHPVAEALAEFGRDRRVRRLPLRGLSRDEVGRMLEGLAAHTPTPALLERVYETTEGVPLFVEEIVRLLAEEGKLDAPPTSLAIPEGIREVIGRRLDKLSEQANQALTTAALLGREFDLPVLQELTGLEEERLLGLLETAAAAQIIAEVPGAVGRYRFVHGLTREALASELSLTRRVRLHSRAGEALERLYGPEAERHAAELAYHFVEAAALPTVQEKAVRYAVLAARAAAVSHGYEEVIRHYEAALGLIQETGQNFGQDEAALLRGLAAAQRSIFRMGEAFRSFRRAMRVAQARGDRQAVAELAWEQTRPEAGVIPPAIAIPILQEGVSASPDQESELVALMQAQMGWLLLTQGRDKDAEDHLLRARELARDHPYSEIKLLLAAIGLRRAMTNFQLELAASLEHDLEQLEGQLGRTMLEGIHVRARRPLLLGNLREAQAYAEKMLEAARRQRDPFALARLLQLLADLHYWRGDFETASGLTDLDEQKGGDPDPGRELIRCVLANARGDVAAACAHAREALVLSQRLQQLFWVAWTAALLAGIERKVGNDEASDTLYRNVLAELDSVAQNKQISVAVHAALAFEAAARRDVPILSRCREALQPYEAFLTVLPSSLPTLTTVRRVLGLIATAEERWDEAVGYLERAIAFCEEKGLVVELAHGRLALADAYRGRKHDGDRERAVATAEQALADYQRLGMPLYEQDARELLASLNSQEPAGEREHDHAE